MRDYGALKAALDEGVAELGRLDIVAANAGIFSQRSGRRAVGASRWDEMIDVNLTGVWHTAKAAIPHLKAAGGGSIILTSSTAGIKGFDELRALRRRRSTASSGLMRTLALELAPDMIRVNTVHPTSVDTPMIQNDALYGLFAPDLEPEQRTREALGERFQAMNALPVPWVEPVDISNAVLFLASDEARYVTGVTLPVDAGSTTK